MMRSRSLLAVVAAAAFVLAACGNSNTGQYGAATTTPSTTSTSSSGALDVATSGLGQIVVDGSGMTVYVYDEDTQGASTSACTGSCLNIWPPVIVTGTPLGVHAHPSGKLRERVIICDVLRAGQPG